tara:strand:+ start:509 stop:739 length:231 start_codon:yes stop_codon:yes gene_type:complete
MEESINIGDVDKGVLTLKTMCFVLGDDAQSIAFVLNDTDNNTSDAIIDGCLGAKTEADLDAVNLLYQNAKSAFLKK